MDEGVKQRRDAPADEARRRDQLLDDRSAYPSLFAPTVWGRVTATFRRVSESPDDDLVANVNVVPFTARGWVVIELEDGRPEVPGGTREPGESIKAVLRRELFEEAGSRLHSFRPFGVWDCVSCAERPFRSHIPHPRFLRLVGVGEVDLVAEPSIGDGEKVVAVHTLSLPDAQARFREADRDDLADLYRLAAACLPVWRHRWNSGERPVGISGQNPDSIAIRAIGLLPT